MLARLTSEQQRGRRVLEDAPTSTRKREPASPSTMRWSKDSASVHDLARHDLPSTTHGIGLMAPKARIADSPGLMIGVPASTPKTPTLVIVIVPPAMSAGEVRPSRAVAVSSLDRRGQLAAATSVARP